MKLKAFTYSAIKALCVCALLLIAIPVCGQNIVFNETFDNLNGEGGNDGKWSYITPTSIGASDLPTGWTMSSNDKPSVRAGKQCVCIGNTTTGKYYLQTATIGAGSYTLSFRAGMWDTQKEKTTILLQAISESKTLLNGDSGDVELTLEKAKFNLYQVDVVVSGKGAKIKFLSPQANSRFFLDDVKLVSVSTTPDAGGSTQVAPTFNFSSSTCTVYWQGSSQATSALLPTLTTNLSASDVVTYASSAPKVATVDEAGAVTIHGTGSTVITAQFAGNETYTAASSSYTLTVVDATQSVCFKRATTFEMNKTYVIVAQYYGKYYLAKFGSELSSDKTVLSEPVTIKDGCISFDSSQASAGYTLVFKPTSTDGLMSLYSPNNDKYLIANESGNGFSFTDNSEVGKWKVDDVPFGDAGEFNLKVGGSYLKFNSSKSYFQTYKMTSNGSAIYLYESVKAPAGVIEIKAPEGFSTYFTDKSYIMPKGVKGATIPSYDEATGKLHYDWAYTEGTVVPANTALVVYADKPGNYAYEEVTTPTTSGNANAADGLERPNDVVGGSTCNNYLHGTLVDALTAEDAASYKFYQLTYAMLNNVKTIGFFFVNEAGGPFINKAHKAYLAMPKSFELTESFALSADFMSTKIETVEQNSASQTQIYTLDGRKVYPQNRNQLPSGIYIINGKKQIIK